MRNMLDKELGKLNNDLIEMGTLIETAIAKAIAALKHQDKELALAVAGYEERANLLEKTIEQTSLKVLLSQQPVARDLRLISAALKLITDMERIADQAMDIAEITLSLIDQVYIREPEIISQMAEKAIIMVNKAVDSFVRQDLKLAKEVIKSDDEVDGHFVEVRDKLITLINEDKSTGEQAIDFIMIAKYLERIADHAVNIAEWVIYYITGEHSSNKYS